LIDTPLLRLYDASNANVAGSIQKKTMRMLITGAAGHVARLYRAHVGAQHHLPATPIFEAGDTAGPCRTAAAAVGNFYHATSD